MNYINDYCRDCIWAENCRPAEMVAADKYGCEYRDTCDDDGAVWADGRVEYDAEWREYVAL